MGEDLDRAAVRNILWGKLLDAARVSHYYQTIADRYRRWNLSLKISLPLLAVINVGAALSLLPEEVLSETARAGVLATSSILIMAVVVWDLVKDYGRRVLVLSEIAKDCRNLEREWEFLWEKFDRYEIDSQTASDENRQLQIKLDEATSKMDLTGLPDDERTNEKSWEYARSVVPSKFAAPAHQS